MKLFSSFKPGISFKKLTDCQNCIKLAAKWAEDEWGYIRNKGVEYREELLRGISDNVFIGFYADQPVAMFALFPHEAHSDLAEKLDNFPKSVALAYVYVNEGFRGLGLGVQIVNQAKLEAHKQDAALIYFDTLKPSLNRFYEKQGAKLVCEGRLFFEPTEVFHLSCEPRTAASSSC